MIGYFVHCRLMPADAYASVSTHRRAMRVLVRDSDALRLSGQWYTALYEAD